MKVIFASRKNCFKDKGGDTNQIILTKKYLEMLDVDVFICEDVREMSSHPDADLLHVFNVQTPDDIYPFVRFAKENNIPVVLSPIYWDLWHAVVVSKFRNSILARIFSYFKPLYKLFAYNCHRGYLSKRYIELRKTIVMASDYVLPNSDEEFVCLCKDLNINLANEKVKAVAVPNAIEMVSRSECQGGVPYGFELSGYILSVGRIEPNKNQLSILKSMLNFPEIPIVFVGRAGTDKKYFDDVVSLSHLRGNVFIFDEVSHDDVQMFYRNALVHVLPSFRESPGLVTLESLAHGCRVVVSDNRFCPVGYYKFDKYAYICNPYSLKSIREAIFSALVGEPINSVSDDYFDFYSYKTSAKITCDIYHRLLETSISGGFPVSE